MAYSLEQKKDIRRTIMIEAGQLLIKKNYHQITISEIAQLAGMAKGTVYNFFDSKEKIFIELYKNEVVLWLEELSRIFCLSASITERLDLVVDHHAERKLFVKLMTILNTVLEQKLDEEFLKDFKYYLLGLVGSTASEIESGSNIFKPGEFGPFVVRYTAFFNGIYHLGLQSRQLEKLFLENPDLSIFSPDTSIEMKWYLRQYFCQTDLSSTNEPGVKND